MNTLYEKLNQYLNEIFKCLERGDYFLLENIEHISKLNDVFLKHIGKFKFDNSPLQNKLTFEDVYELAREIVGRIDEHYLADFDQLIESGELEFIYEYDIPDSKCTYVFENGRVKRKLINIDREFTYDDVWTLVHEFIHYTNGKQYTTNRYYFTEFLSIYFELFAIDYLLDRGINVEEIDPFYRLKEALAEAESLSWYEIPLLAYEYFGQIDEQSIRFLQKFVINIDIEQFEKECSNLCKNFSRIEENEKDRINEDPQMLGKILSEKFITSNYRYVLGTILAFYARKYANFEDIVYLNNHIDEYAGESVDDICLRIGIDLSDEHFVPKLFGAIDEYVSKKQKYFDKNHAKSN